MSMELTGLNRNRLVTYLYFRSTEDVQRFAHEKLHTLYSREYQNTQPELLESEVFHELFAVRSLQDFYPQ